MPTLRILCLAALWLAALSPSAAAALQASATLRGTVTNATARPVSEALVRLSGRARLEAITDGSGRFVVKDIPAGPYMLRVEHLAYAARADSIALGPGEDLAVQIELATTALELEPITVTVRPRKLVMVGFYDRQQRGMGTYFTRDDIEERKVQRLSDLLSRVPGLRRTLNQDGSSRIDVRGVKTIMTNCATQYFIDGIRAEIGAIGVDVIPPRDIDGIEIYRGSSELPIQFDVGRAMCGAILIWTRGG